MWKGGHLPGASGKTDSHWPSDARRAVLALKRGEELAHGEGRWPAPGGMTGAIRLRHEGALAHDDRDGRA